MTDLEGAVKRLRKWVGPKNAKGNDNWFVRDLMTVLDELEKHRLAHVGEGDGKIINP
jgi:hypothetical protein